MQCLRRLVDFDPNRSNHERKKIEKDLFGHGYKKEKYKTTRSLRVKGPAVKDRRHHLKGASAQTGITGVLSATPALPNSGLEGFPGAFNPRKLFPHLLPSVEAHPVAAGPILLQVLLVFRPGLIIGNGTGLCIQHYLGQGILFGSCQGSIQPRSMESSFESAQRLGHFVRKRLYIDVAQTIFYLALRVVTFHRLLRSLFGRKVQAPCQPIKTRGSRARRQLSWRVLHSTKGRLQHYHRRSSGKSLQERLAKRSSVVFGFFSPSSTRSLPPSTFECLGETEVATSSDALVVAAAFSVAPAAGTTSCSVERIVVGAAATTPLKTTPAGAETSIASATSSRRTGDTPPSLLLLEEAPAVLLAAPCSTPPAWEALEGSLSFEQVEPLASSMAGLPDPSLTTTSPSSIAISCATSRRSVEATRGTPSSADCTALFVLRSSNCAPSSSSSVPSSSCGGVTGTAFCFFRARSCSASSALSSTRTGLFLAEAEGRLAPPPSASEARTPDGTTSLVAFFFRRILPGPFSGVWALAERPPDGEGATSAV
ncbi:hypothetical protein Taro_057021, partial [Colocasia esculenta]|nr:hypothetical protein [Colocasia esculenta]